MASAGNLRVARKIANGSAIVIKEYIDDMRGQGRISGELSIVVKEGGTERRLPYLLSLDVGS
jgi:hypothetical protein